MDTITKTYREFLEATSWYTHADEGNAPELAYLALGLCGEAGEAGDCVKKVIRNSGMLDIAAFEKEMDVDTIINYALELGDVKWYHEKILMFLGLTGEDIMVMNTIKLWTRLIELRKIDPKTVPFPFPVALHDEHAFVGLMRQQMAALQLRLEEEVPHHAV